MEKREIVTFEEAVDYLCETPKFTKKHTLEETKAFLHTLGDPDRQMRILHVAGTNGKGSVCAYLCSVLEEAGYQVCMFTSPHLVDIRERFRIKGHLVEKEEFLWAFLQIYERLDDYRPTFFEYLFFMAMLLFAKAGADFCILETGLGGRLDATNAVEKKELCVITRISLDHVEYLGDTVEQIAGEKAGILRGSAPLVCLDEEPAFRVLSRMAGKTGIKVHPLSKKDYTFLDFKNKNIDFSLHTRYYDYISLRLHTAARYQMENASLAVYALEALDGGRTISTEHIVRGIEKCFWQGRMEEVLPEVYVDGAHNEDGIRAFLDTVSQDEAEGGRSLLFGVMADKDYVHMVQKIAQSGLFAHIAVAFMRSDRAVPPAQLQELFAGYPNCVYTRHDSVAEAFRALSEGRKKGERVYIAGSLYLVGEIKELLKNDQF
ncbi:MAG: bifunctional folylpolyglutamate synthase/dihydrofolate synthase [Candidatus Gastranaerophilales bacterium]|nr:bifunctional folylpolyglutamate synthase/dihydrofolate synthase [Candidatus Gastranaerophilales bacterium]